LAFKILSILHIFLHIFYTGIVAFNAMLVAFNAMLAALHQGTRRCIDIGRKLL
jgi:hypothetical protein